MKFYEIDNALLEAVNAGDKAVRIKIEIKLGDHFENILSAIETADKSPIDDIKTSSISIFEQDIIYANFYSLKEKAGGVSSRGEVLISNEQVFLRNQVMSNYAGSEVRVSFSMGEGLTYFHRFTFYIDSKGCQKIRHGRKKYIYIGLEDLSYKLRKTDEARDWTSPAVFTYSVVCDKTQPQKSLVHGIAQRAGLSVSDIDCSTIPINLPYVKLRRNIWAELSSMATAYRCHLECAVEKPLVFAHSPYQNEQLASSNEQYSYTFRGDNIFYLRVTERTEHYRNTVRLKINLPVVLERQEIWRYDDPPVIYDDGLIPHFPFRNPHVREIENGNYEAKYRVIDESGKERNVVFADDIDTKQEAENRLVFIGGNFSYSQYDVTAHNDKAILKLQKENDSDLYCAVIHGRPIVLDLNRSCFIRDLEAVERFGTVALNVTGSYFSEDVVETKNGVPILQYEDWVMRELTERLQNRREFTVKTHRGLFNARVGAKVKLEVRSEKLEVGNKQLEGTISAIAFRYKKDKAFVASFKIKEGCKQ